MGRWLYRIVAAGSQPPAGPDRLPGPGHAGCCVAGAAPAPRRAAGLGRTPPAAARRVTWDRLMPVSDLHRQIAVLALAAAGEHGFALGGASALLVRGVISRSTQDAGLFTGQEHGVQAEWATKPSTPRKRSAPTGRSSPAAAVGDRASHSHLPPARCRPACRVPARPCQLAEQPVQPSACPLVGDDHPVAAFLGRSHPGPGQILASGRPPGTQAPARRAAAACQPGNRTASLLSVHKHVDHLCATAPSLCKPSGNAGDSAAWPQPWWGLYLGERESRPVQAEKTEIIHMPRRNR